MTVLSLDQSSNVSGYAVFKEGKLFTCGKFTTSSSLALNDRLVQIIDWLDSLLQEYHPDHVIFEDIQLQANIGNNIQTFKVLAEVFGVIYEHLTRLKISNSCVLATVWKNKLKIEGRKRAEQKASAKQLVNKLFNISPTEDECDAICIGIYYHILLG